MNDRPGQVTESCPIGCLPLSARTANALRWSPEGGETVGGLIDLLNSGMLERVRNIGPRSVEEIRTALIYAGFQLEPHPHADVCPNCQRVIPDSGRW